MLDGLERIVELRDLHLALLDKVAHVLDELRGNVLEVVVLVVPLGVLDDGALLADRRVARAAEVLEDLVLVLRARLWLVDLDGVRKEEKKKKISQRDNLERFMGVPKG